MKKILLAVMVFAAVLANGAEKIRLWEGDAPLAKGSREIDIPTLEIFLPENKDRAITSQLKSGVMLRAPLESTDEEEEVCLRMEFELI